MNNITFEIENIQTKKENFPNCWICNDQGMVFFNVKKDKMFYECVARCKCRLGQESSEKIPIVKDDFAQHLAEANFNRFQKIYPDLVTDLVG